MSMDMVRLELQLEYKESGIVQARVLEFDEGDHPSTLLWECTVAQEMTRGAQKAALKATMDYLNRFIDLSQGQHR